MPSSPLPSVPAPRSSAIRQTGERGTRSRWASATSSAPTRGKTSCAPIATGNTPRPISFGSPSGSAAPTAPSFSEAAILPARFRCAARWATSSPDTPSNPRPALSFGTRKRACAAIPPRCCPGSCRSRGSVSSTSSTCCLIPRPITRESMNWTSRRFTSSTMHRHIFAPLATRCASCCHCCCSRRCRSHRFLSTWSACNCCSPPRARCSPRSSVPAW